MKRSDADNKSLFAQVLLDLDDVLKGVDNEHLLGQYDLAAQEAHKLVDGDKRKLVAEWDAAKTPADRESVTDQALIDGRAAHENLKGAPPLPLWYSLGNLFQSSQPLDQPKDISYAHEAGEQTKKVLGSVVQYGADIADRVDRKPVYVEPKKPKKSNAAWWLLGGGALLGIGAVVLLKE